MSRTLTAALAAAATAALLLAGAAPAGAAPTGSAADFPGLGDRGTAPSADAPTEVAPLAGWVPTVERLGGVDRYDTALKISAQFPADVPRVFIATGTNFPDALGASGIAGAIGSPLLLVDPSFVPAGVADEITRLNPEEIVIVGGTNAVSTAVENTLGQIAPVSRLAGSDRYDTNRQTVSYLFSPGVNQADVAIIATGRNYPDALAASAASGNYGWPVVLVDGQAGATDSDTKALLTNTGVGDGAGDGTVVVGGTEVVSPGIASELSGLYPNFLRLSGADRYGTSFAVNDAFFATDYDTAFLAVGTGFADALAGGPLAANADERWGGPLYLVQQNCVPADVKAALEAAQPARIVLLGGTAVLGAGVENLTSC
jgi:putative cell wall-binding protein